MFKLVTGKDSSGVTFGYTIENPDTGDVALQGDGYETEDAIIIELSELNEVLRNIFG